jgi:hypothetical protein
MVPLNSKYRIASVRSRCTSAGLHGKDLAEVDFSAKLAAFSECFATAFLGVTSFFGRATGRDFGLTGDIVIAVMTGRARGLCNYHIIFIADCRLKKRNEKPKFAVLLVTALR